MYLSNISVEGLFYKFSHSIDFQKDEKVKIIHGPNGIGKTTILHLLYNLFKKRYYDIIEIPFETFTLKYLLPSTKLIIKRISDPKLHSEYILSLTLKNPDGQKSHTISRRGSRYSSQYRIPLRIFADYLPFLRSLGPGLWRDMNTGSKITIEGIIERYSDRLPDRVLKEIEPYPGWLEEFIGAVSIHLIDTRRLFVSDSPGEKSSSSSGSNKQTYAVNSYAKEMASSLYAIQREFGLLSNKYERTFIHRLLKRSDENKYDENDIRIQHENQTLLRNRLMQTGILSSEDEPEPKLPQGKLEASDVKALSIYLDDVEQKFKNLIPLLNKAELFKQIINSHFNEKQLILDSKEGFIIMDEKSQSIPLHLLSSGEQHTLVMAYKYIFTIEEGSLVLIDEPEISLHVYWQRMFLDDLSQISELVNANFLIATHSPSIVHGHSNIMTELGFKK